MAKEYDRCLLCGRKLKDSECRRIGYGRVCYKKLTTQHRQRKLFQLTNLDCLHNMKYYV